MSSKDKKGQKQPLVPETVQKRQTRDAKLSLQNEKLRAERKQKNIQRKSDWIKRAQQYQKEYQEAERTEIDNNRKVKLTGEFYVPAQPKLYVVTRIKGIRGLHPDVNKTFRLLRLRQLNNTVFVRVNAATTNMLRKIQAYVAYGYPTVSTIRKLVYKRGYGKVQGRRIPLQDNKLIEQNLGKQGITCIEDLIHEIHTVGPNFKDANNFLWSFKLNNPRGGFNCKRHPYHTDGDWGNREEYINDLINDML